MEFLGATITHSRRSDPASNTFDDVLEIARASQFRIRRVQLRDRWQESDAGPLLAWHGRDQTPVALIRERGRYAMVNPENGRAMLSPLRRRMELHPKPSASTARCQHIHSVSRFALLRCERAGQQHFSYRIGVVAIGLLSLVAPLVTNLSGQLGYSPHGDDQLVVCAAALAVTAVAMGCLQGMQDWLRSG